MSFLDRIRNRRPRPTASDIMIERYGIEDAERYKADHRRLIGGSFALGIALAGWIIGWAIAYCNISGLYLPVLFWSVLFMAYGYFLFGRVYRGGSRS